MTIRFYVEPPNAPHGIARAQQEKPAYGEAAFRLGTADAVANWGRDASAYKENVRHIYVVGVGHNAFERIVIRVLGWDPYAAASF